MTIRFTNPQEQRKNQAQTRLKIFQLSLCLGFLAIVGRSVFLMLEDNRHLDGMATRQYRVGVQKETMRGKILDRKGKELAINTPAWALYADPHDVKNPRQVAAQLSKVLNLSVSTLYEKLTDKRRFVWLKRGIDSGTLEKFSNLKQGGVYTMKDSRRYYPHGELATTLLGSVGVDGQALGGIESAYDSYLLMNPSSGIYLKDARGRLYLASTAVEEKTVTKGDVYLTIDKNLQFFAEAALKKAVDKANAKGGIAIVIDPKTGEILAMAEKGGTTKQEHSRAVMDVYEPGSTFKTILVAGALESKVVSLGEKVFCENGELALPGGHVIHDHQPYGLLSVSEVIKFSSNIGAYKIAKRLGKKGMYDWIAAFGFGQKTGIDFPGETAGLIKNYNRWGPTEEATTAFGQGVGVTPLQMVSAFATIANGGIRMRPHLVAKVAGGEGELLYQSREESLGQVIDSETAKTMRQILRGVVEEGGTAPLAEIEEYPVAGKTGTAQKAVANHKGYENGKFVASFIGFAPEADPRLAALVLIDEPQGSHYGGQIAAPVFKEIMRYALQYVGLPPAKENKLDTPVWTAENGEENGQPTTDQPREEAVYGQWSLPDRQAGVVRGSSSSFQVPDFRGASLRHVLKAVTDYPVAVELKGRGVATTQSPKPGTTILAGSKIYVGFEPLY